MVGSGGLGSTTTRSGPSKKWVTPFLSQKENGDGGCFLPHRGDVYAAGSAPPNKEEYRGPKDLNTGSTGGERLAEGADFGSAAPDAIFGGAAGCFPAIACIAGADASDLQAMAQQYSSLNRSKVINTTGVSSIAAGHSVSGGADLASIIDAGATASDLQVQTAIPDVRDGIIPGMDTVGVNVGICLGTEPVNGGTGNDSTDESHVLAITPLPSKLEPTFQTLESSLRQAG